MPPLPRAVRLASDRLMSIPRRTKEGNMSKSRPSRGAALLWLALLVLGAGVISQPATADAQQSTITGTVTDAQTGEPLAAAPVMVAGSGAGTLTDASGRYSIQASPNGSLNVSRLGYTTVQIPIEGRSTVNVELSVSATQLEELVVTGYGTQRRGDITAAISTVD